jgi:putative phosphoesterase
MPRIALVSDTHLPRFGRRLPTALMESLAAEGPELVLHLGDHTDGAAVEELARIAAVDAVAGNNDPEELVARFGLRRIVEIAGFRIGLTHGHLGTGRTTPDRALATFAGDVVDIVAFGHSHVPLVQWRGDVLLVNPGSPTDRRRQPCPTFALLELPDPSVAASIPSARIVALPLPMQRHGRETGSGR